MADEKVEKSVEIAEEVLTDTVKSKDGILDEIVESVKPQQSVLAVTLASVFSKFIVGTVKNKVVRTLLVVLVTAIGAYFSATADGNADLSEIIQAIANAITQVLTG